MIIKADSGLKLYIGPLKAYRFIIEMDGYAECAFMKFSGINMEVHTIQARSGNDYRGVQEYIPVLTTYQPVTLTKGVIVSSRFLEWLKASSASMYSGPSGVDVYRTINVVALDDVGNHAVTWTLKDAMPIRYELDPMDASRSEILTESVSFAIQGMSRSIDPVYFNYI